MTDAITKHWRPEIKCCRCGVSTLDYHVIDPHIIAVVLYFEYSTVLYNDCGRVLAA